MNEMRMPWRVEENSRYRGLWDVYDCDGNQIVAGKIKEVARLIAAAPELLEACKQIVWKLSFNHRDSDYEGPARIDRNDAVVRMAVAAIVRAEEE